MKGGKGGRAGEGQSRRRKQGLREGWASCPELELGAGGVGEGRMGSRTQCGWKGKNPAE